MDLCKIFRNIDSWHAWSGSDPHYNTKPTWPACRLKTHWERIYSEL